jgi:hypothetical protein
MAAVEIAEYFPWVIFFRPRIFQGKHEQSTRSGRNEKRRFISRNETKILVMAKAKA